MSSPTLWVSDPSSSSKGVSISSEIMVAAIVFFFMVIVFVFFLHIYAKRRWGPAAVAARRSRLVFADNQDPAAALRRGLDPAVILSLPVSVYRSEDFKEGGGLECAVCLSDLADGEKARLLPSCNHGFHLECIDMWFQSHSTCPLCRRPLGPETEPAVDLESGEAAVPAGEYPTESPPNLPTNVLFWGTQGQVSTAATSASQEATVTTTTSAAAPIPPSSSSGKSGGALVIEIPRRAAAEGLSSSSPLPSSRFPAEDMKSPAGAGAATTPTRLRSLRRLLSRETRVAVAVGSSCSPCAAAGGRGDIEQGFARIGRGEVGSSVAPRTPTTS